jgi:transcription elongation factor Elf1
MADYPTVCAYCGAQNVYPCSDRVDDGDRGQNITVLRCTKCGKNA